MKVSISIITYNHEKYIAQAIDSALMQNTSFDYEIIIGEDDSTDKTREIVKTYKEKYLDKIRLFLNDRKNVIYVGGKPTGRWNFINNLKHAQGKYVALLEGDDYWTSPHKLQKQVDFLDNHPECAICFHNVKNIFEDGSREPEISVLHRKREIYTLKDLVGRNFITGCTIMFRNGLIGEFPDWFYTVPVGDLSLNVLNAQHGDIGYINEVMAVYRLHKGGIWSTRGNISSLQAAIEMHHIINTHLNFCYDKIIKADIFLRQAQIATEKGNRCNAIINLFKSFLRYPVYPFTTPWRLYGIYLQIFSPRLYRFLKSRRNN